MRFLSIALLLIASIYPSLSVSIDKCYPKQTDFAKACTTELNGVADGGHCFFFNSNYTNWNKSWDACARFGAQLAQIHTESEYNKILNYLKSLGVISTTGPKYALIALYDSKPRAPELSSTCTMNLDSTMWYDHVTSPNPLLTTGNTWIRYHQCAFDNSPNSPPSCFVIFDKTGSGAVDVGDWTCYETAGAVCQYNNPAQDFTATTYCLTEIPIATAPATEPDDCSQECGSRGWCRGFNYVFNGNSFMCQLFPWSVYDTCPKCASRVAASTSCTYFNYVQ